MEPKEIFKEFCHNNDMRYTPERGVVIDEIYRTHKHFDVDTLFLSIRNRYPKIKLARGSIYRTIPHLIQAGLVRESFADDGKLCYEHTLGHAHHDHLKCISCGKVFEFYEKDIDLKQVQLCKRRKFKMISHMHVIYGLCEKCRKK